MGLKLAKDAVKIGFADIGVRQFELNSPSPFGYFADDKTLTVDERKNILFSRAAEESCDKQIIYKDDTIITTASDKADPSLPTNQELTKPPKTQQLLDNPYVQAAILGAGVYFFIKLVS